MGPNSDPGNIYEKPVLSSLLQHHANIAPTLLLSIQQE